jgi:glycosyltransferase involved in cell wall biosynthesis
MREDRRSRLDQEVLHVVPFYDNRFGGSVTAAKSIVYGLQDRGVAVRIWTSDLKDLTGAASSSEAETEHRVGVEKYRVVARALFRSTNLAATPKMILDSLLRDYNPRLIHLHDYRSVQAGAAYLFARRLAIPLVLQPHGSLALALERIGPKRVYDFIVGVRVLDYASRVIVLSEKEADQCKELGVPQSKILKIPNGVKMPDGKEEALRGRFRNKHGINRDEFVVLFLGRIRESKGVRTLVGALGELAQDRQHMVLVMCGPDDGIGESLRRTANDLGVRLLLAGFVDGTAKEEVFVDSDVFCLPSAFETQSMSLLEAASHGLPIVAGTANCPPEFFAADAGLFTPLTAPTIATALAKLADSPNLRIELGTRARAVAKEHFSIDVTIDRLLKAYQDL